MTNPKRVCPNCNILKRTKCFHHNRVLKKDVCTTCNKKIGNNIFYVPFEKRGDYIGKYSITELEKKRLFIKYRSWDKVNEHIELLKKQKSKTKYSEKERKRYFAMKAEQQKQQQKKFLEGLKLKQHYI